MGIYTAILLSCFLFLKIKFNRIYEINMRYLKSDQFPYYLILIEFSIVGVSIWFLKSPVFRFGYSYLTLLIASVFCIILSKKLLKKK